MANKSLGDYGELQALNFAAGISPAMALTVYLYTDSVDAAGTGTEVASGIGYTPTAVTFGTATQVGGVTSIKNSAPVVFSPATAAWGTVTSLALKDGSGNVWWYGDLTTPKTVGLDDQLQFAINAIVLTMD